MSYKPTGNKPGRRPLYSEPMKRVLVRLPRDILSALGPDHSAFIREAVFDKILADAERKGAVNG